MNTKMKRSYNDRHHDYSGHDPLLCIYERRYPNDLRPRAAIEMKRRWIKGEATNDELHAARIASNSAAFDDSEALYASIVVTHAAHDVIDVIVDHVAYTAARVAVENVSVSYVASCAVSIAASADTEKEWQVQHLRELLGE